MWTKRMSLRLSQVCVFVFLAALWAGTGLITVGLPGFLDYLGGVFTEPQIYTQSITFLYAGFVLGNAVLIALHFLLRNISKGLVFVPANVKLLRLLSWLCFGAAGIFLAAGSVHFIFPFYIAPPVAFAGLLLRVFKNTLAAAVALKAENDLTI